MELSTAQFKALVLDLSNVSDEEVENVFPDVVITDEDDIHFIFDALETHRSDVLKRLKEKYSEIGG